MQTGTGLTGAERELSAVSLPALRNEDVSRGERIYGAAVACVCLGASSVRKQELRLGEDWERV